MLMTHNFSFFNELTVAYLAKIMLFKRNSLDDDGTLILYSIVFAKILLNKTTTKKF